VRHGALYGPAVGAGEWWRIVTGAFLHAGLVHLALNMLALWTVGRLYEGLVGHGRFALTYATALLGGAIGVLRLNYDEPTVGASGAVFGLFGALVAAGLRLGPAGRTLVRQTVPIIAINLLFGFGANSVAGGNVISNVGHLGGLGAGFVAAWLLGVPRRTVAAMRAADEPTLAAVAPPPERRPPGPPQP